MPEKRRAQKERRGGDDLTDLQWDFLNDEVPADDPRRSDPALKWRFYELDGNRALGNPDARPCAALWATYGPEILARWTVEHPGTRPTCWWRFQGPDGPDAGASCAPPLLQQPAMLDRLGVLTPAERQTFNLGDSRGRA